MSVVRHQSLVGMGLAILALAAPLLAPNDYVMGVITRICLYALLALGLNIVVGFAGLLDLGYVAFFGIGSYIYAFLASPHFGIHLPFVVILPIIVAATAVSGILIGAPTLRLRGDYLAIVTLAFGEIVPRVFENATSGIFGIGSTDFSNGRQGITPIDKINLPWTTETLKYPLELKPVYYVGLAMVLLVIFFNRRLRDSRLGRAWIAVREDEVAAAAMGVNLVRTKLWAYAIGAALGGFAGVFLGTYNNTVNVDQFEFGLSVFILCMVIIGGMGNIWGVILGAIALSMVDRFVLSWINENVDVGFDITAINFGIFGFFLLIMMVLRPEGLLPNRRRRIELTGSGEVDDSLYEVEQA